MKRYHEEQDRTRRAHQVHLRQLHNWPIEPVVCICDKQAGRFRKRHALGCGKSRCHLCKYEKIYDIPSPRERRLQLAADAALCELWEAQKESRTFGEEDTWQTADVLMGRRGEDETSLLRLLPRYRAALSGEADLQVW